MNPWFAVAKFCRGWATTTRELIKNRGVSQERLAEFYRGLGLLDRDCVYVHVMIRVANVVDSIADSCEMRGAGGTSGGDETAPGLNIDLESTRGEGDAE